MATGVLERIRTDERTDSSLKAYGKLSGGAEPAEMTEEQKALNFNSRISDNYKKLINPDLKKAEEIMGEALYRRTMRSRYTIRLNRMRAPCCIRSVSRNSSRCRSLRISG